MRELALQEAKPTRRASPRHSVANPRGPVFCSHCNRMKVIDTLQALLEDGWPICCGEFMAVESPEEIRRQKEGIDGSWKKVR